MDNQTKKIHFSHKIVRTSDLNMLRYLTTYSNIYRFAKDHHQLNCRMIMEDDQIIIAGKHGKYILEVAPFIALADHVQTVIDFHLIDKNIDIGTSYILMRWLMAAGERIEFPCHLKRWDIGVTVAFNDNLKHLDLIRENRAYLTYV